MIAELQFQLVMRGFCQGEDEAATIVQLTAEDAFKLEDRVEANMIQLQADLHEAKSRNIYLNDLVEEQKRQVNCRLVYVIIASLTRYLRHLPAFSLLFLIFISIFFLKTCSSK